MSAVTRKDLPPSKIRDAVFEVLRDTRIMYTVKSDSTSMASFTFDQLSCEVSFRYPREKMAFSMDIRVPFRFPGQFMPTLKECMNNLNFSEVSVGCFVADPDDAHVYYKTSVFLRDVSEPALVIKKIVKKGLATFAVRLRHIVYLFKFAEGFSTPKHKHLLLPFIPPRNSSCTSCRTSLESSTCLYCSECTFYLCEKCKISSTDSPVSTPSSDSRGTELRLSDPPRGLTGPSPAPDRITTSLPKIDYRELTCMKPIGQGTFGEVFSAKLNGLDVAVKRHTQNDPAGQAQFWKEIEILTQVRSPNIILSMGYCVEPPCLISELMDCSLYDVIHTKHMEIPKEKQQKIAISVASGLSSLHSQKFAHRDLKSPNVLVTNDLSSIKLCDVGLSKVLPTSGTASQCGSPYWMAPEVILHKPYNLKIDIYSFAILLYEVIECKLPSCSDSPNPLMFLAEAAKGQRPTMVKATDFWRTLITMCWAHDPEKRPDIASVLAYLDPAPPQPSPPADNIPRQPPSNPSISSSSKKPVSIGPESRTSVVISPFSVLVAKPFVAPDDSCLSLEAGNSVLITDIHDADWWQGFLDNQEGRVPVSHLKITQEVKTQAEQLKQQCDFVRYKSRLAQNSKSGAPGSPTTSSTPPTVLSGGSSPYGKGPSKINATEKPSFTPDKPVLEPAQFPPPPVTPASPVVSPPAYTPAQIEHNTPPRGPPQRSHVQTQNTTPPVHTLPTPPPMAGPPRPPAPATFHRLDQEFVVAYDWQSNIRDGLPLVRGHIVKCLETNDQGWYRGIDMTTNIKGIFPASHVVARQARVLYDLPIERQPGDLPFTVGEIITVLSTTEQWWRGLNSKNEEGIFPPEIVQLL
ncbi:protein kinase [Pelomyxa schiedti]|nr:protein kinase [Pelomyxa schiedti]